MPSPPKTTDAAIVAAARKLVEELGFQQVSMNDVARAVGIQTPSLYRRFAGRADLLAAVEVGLWGELGRALARAPRSSDATRSLTALAGAYRRFAKANPNGYALIFDAEAERTKEGQVARSTALAVCMPAFVSLVGESDALAAARVLTPFLHGFVSMELARAFRMGPNIDQAFAHGVDTILKGLQPGRRWKGTRRGGVP
jgi:AcrR family transcriptional regulator